MIIHDLHQQVNSAGLSWNSAFSNCLVVHVELSSFQTWETVSKLKCTVYTYT